MSAARRENAGITAMHFGVVAWSRDPPRWEGGVNRPTADQGALLVARGRVLRRLGCADAAPRGVRPTRRLRRPRAVEMAFFRSTYALKPVEWAWREDGPGCFPHQTSEVPPHPAGGIRHSIFQKKGARNIFWRGWRYLGCLVWETPRSVLAIARAFGAGRAPPGTRA